MKVVRERADARWLPSRFHFAIFRLFAYVRLRSSRPEPRPGLVLSVDRDQTAAESYIVCIVAMIAIASFFHSPLLGILVAIVAPQAAIVGLRFVVQPFRSADAPTFEDEAWIILFAMIAVAIWRAQQSYVARAFLALVVLNAIAAVVMFALRGSVKRLEGQFE